MLDKTESPNLDSTEPDALNGERPSANDDGAVSAEPICPACACPGATLYVTGDRDPDRPIQRLFRFFLCSCCRLRFQTMNQQEAARQFADVEMQSDHHYTPSRRELLCDEEIVRAFAGMGPGRRLLDIGAGDGNFLAAAQKMGFDCLGVDVSENLARIAQKRSGVPVLVGQLTDLDLAERSFDWINLDQVLSYVPNLRDMMRRVGELLRPGGICRIREYDADSLSSRLKGKKYWMYAPTHVNVSTGKSIAALAEVAGLKVVRVIPGTESTLASWLATDRSATLRKRFRDTLLFGLRRVRLLGVSVAADTVFYLRKPGERET